MITPLEFRSIKMIKLKTILLNMVKVQDTEGGHTFTIVFSMGRLNLINLLKYGTTM